ncbi:MAG: helix-turn-helix domain-containing protein [Nitrososphaerota archaeon]|nr:helix-turn-helix domain-containing protein [Nitrososphaerota archaeon]
MSEPQAKECTCSAEGQELKVITPAQRRSVLTVEEAAEMLGLSRAFAYEAVNRGEIPSIRIGRRILVPKVALDRLLDSADGQ